MYALQIQPELDQRAAERLASLDLAVIGAGRSDLGRRDPARHHPLEEEGLEASAAPVG